MELSLSHTGEWSKLSSLGLVLKIGEIRQGRSKGGASEMKPVLFVVPVKVYVNLV